MTVQLSGPVSQLCLSKRPANCLEAAGIKTVQDLTHTTPEELEAIHGMGYVSIREIVDALWARGLVLRERGTISRGWTSADIPPQHGNVVLVKDYLGIPYLAYHRGGQWHDCHGDDYADNKGWRDPLRMWMEIPE